MTDRLHGDDDTYYVAKYAYGALQLVTKRQNLMLATAAKMMTVQQWVFLTL